MRTEYLLRVGSALNRNPLSEEHAQLISANREPGLYRLYRPFQHRQKCNPIHSTDGLSRSKAGGLTSTLWMREIAHRADSAITSSPHCSSRCRVSISRGATEARASRELPAAIHTLRNNPLHLVL